jgi:hypothetical protein
MQRLFFFIAIFLTFLSIQVSAQRSRYVGHSMGFGIGRDYGGIGMRYTHSANDVIGIFGALGYNFAGPGFNGGVLTRLNPKSRACLYLIGMYGYIYALEPIQGGWRGENFYGPTAGSGLELHLKRKPLNYFNFEILFPLLTQSYYNKIEKLEKKGWQIDDNPPTIGFSLGYHFGF